MSKFQVVAMIGVNAQDSKDAIAEVASKFGDSAIVLHVEQDQERTSVGRFATKILEGMASVLNRALVIRCDNNFRPYIMDYPPGAGRPYDVNLNVSEIVGMYEDSMSYGDPA